MKKHATTLLLFALLTAAGSAAAKETAPSDDQAVVPVVVDHSASFIAPTNDEIPGPKITPGPAITLPKALEMAADRNLDLASARMEIEKAKAGLSMAWGLVLPYAQGKLDYTHMDHEDELDLTSSMAPLLGAMGITLPPGTDLGDPMLVNPKEKLVGSIQVMLPLINAESWMKIHTAKQGVEVTELSIEQARRQILMGTSQAYFMVLTTRDLIDFYHAQIVTTTAQLRVANARFKAGKGMRIDVIRAETDLEQATQSLLTAQLSFDNARDILGQLIGVEGLPLPSDNPTLQEPGTEESDLLERASRNRLDLKTAAAIVELMDRQRKAVWMQFIPSLDAVWQGSYQFSEMVDLGSDDRSRWAVMLSLTVPLYNHFRYAALDQKRASLKQAEIKLQNTQEKSNVAVRSASRNYTTALAAVATAEKQLTLAKEGISLAEAAYRNGRGTSLDVTQSQQAYAAAGLNLATLQFKAQLALLSLLDAIGEEIPAQVQ